jgi:hypothetical protein
MLPLGKATKITFVSRENIAEEIRLRDAVLRKRLRLSKPDGNAL